VSWLSWFMGSWLSGSVGWLRCRFVRRFIGRFSLCQAEGKQNPTAKKCRSVRAAASPCGPTCPPPCHSANLKPPSPSSNRMRPEAPGAWTRCARWPTEAAPPHPRCSASTRAPPQAPHAWSPRPEHRMKSARPSVAGTRSAPPPCRSGFPRLHAGKMSRSTP